MKYKGLLAALLLIITFAGIPAHDGNFPQEIALSWRGDTRTTQSVTWTQPDTLTPAEIKYIKASEYNGNFIGTKSAGASKILLSNGLARFEGELTGLTPNTEYLYWVGAGKDFSSGTVFRTGDDRDTFSFVFMGDAQASPDEGSYTEWGNLLGKALSEGERIAFLLMAGDLINDGNNISEWGDFFAASQGKFAETPVMAAMGNHDSGGLLTKYFAFPENGPFEVKEQFYSFDYGNAHFIIMDSNLMGIYNKSYADWVEKDLSSTDKAWKIVMLHHPFYPASNNPKEMERAEKLQKNWLSIFEENEVDLVLCGHQHVYMRTHPLRGGKKDVSGKGIIYLMGVSGGKMYPFHNFSYIHIAVEKTGCYTLFHIEGEKLSLTTKDKSGNILDSAVVAN